MQVKLTIQEKLKDLRTERGLNLEELAAKTDLSKSALGEYETNENKDISLHAIVKLADFYGVSTDYLLGLTEIKNHANAELHSLHLRDDMIELLRSGRINNRLLCEIVLHPAFPQLLTDIEICVDRIADMRIKDMNGLLETTRQAIMQKYSPEDTDLYLRTLEVAQVSEDIFFSHILHKELETIIRDIRDAHEKDITTADLESDTADATSDIQQKMQQALLSDGTLRQKRARAAGIAMKLDYDKLSESDQQALERISSISPVFATVMSQRGKGMSAMSHGSGKRKKR